MGSLKFQVNMEWSYLRSGISRLISSQAFHMPITSKQTEKRVDLVLDAAFYLHDYGIISEGLDQPGACLGHYRPLLHQLSQRYRRREVNEFYCDFGQEEKGRLLRLLSKTHQPVLSKIFQLIPPILFGKETARWLRRDYNLPYPDFDVYLPIWKKSPRLPPEEMIILWDNARAIVGESFGTRGPRLGSINLLGTEDELPFSLGDYFKNPVSSQAPYLDERLFNRLDPISVGSLAVFLALVTSDAFPLPKS